VRVINHVVPREELESFTQQMAMQIVQTSPLVLRILKEELRVLARLIRYSGSLRAHPVLRREVYDSEIIKRASGHSLRNESPSFTEDSGVSIIRG